MCHTGTSNGGKKWRMVLFQVDSFFNAYYYVCEVSWKPFYSVFWQITFQFPKFGKNLIL